MYERPRFITTQRILLLDADVGDSRLYLRPEHFRSARVPAWERESRDSLAGRWERVSRSELLLERNIPRLCLLADAGLGKTTTLRWAEKELNAGHREGSLALYCRLADLPVSREGYRTKLLGLLRHAPGNHSIPEPEGCRLIDRLLSEGRLTLLVDALDQTKTGPGLSPDPRIESLAEFLNIDARFCNVVVASRPYAIDAYWRELFGGVPWRFAQLDYFTPAESLQYIGESRYRYLVNLDVEILLIPRWLTVIRGIEAERLEYLRTACEIYWEGLRHMIELGVATDPVRAGGFSAGDCTRLLAALAFEMIRTDNYHGVDEGEFVGAFREEVWRRHFHGTPIWSDFRDFCAQLDLLGQTNEGLDHGFLDGWGLRQLFWRDRSLQEFFAALWLTSFAGESDLHWIAERPYVRNDPGSAALYWVWRFAAEMPDGCREARRWVGVLGSLFHGSVPRGAGRSTEMLYRSWNAMRRYVVTHSAAGEAIDRYRAEFPSIVLGRYGERPRELARQILDGFLPAELPVRPGEELKFVMGAHPGEVGRNPKAVLHEVHLTPFEVAAHPVTNVEYELFDPGHAACRWPEPQDDDRCPVTNVSWFDAWAFCRWLGEAYRLPTEAEWEYACRAGTSSPFSSGDAISSREANFDGNYPYGDAPKGPYLRRTTPAGSYAPNPLGLYDMHGNVWEWCHDWYDDDYYSYSPPSDPLGPSAGAHRVIRGGGWFSPAQDCRSSSRFHADTKSAENYNIGVRVVRSHLDLDAALGGPSSGALARRRTRTGRDDTGQGCMIVLLDSSSRASGSLSAKEAFDRACEAVAGGAASRALLQSLAVLHIITYSEAGPVDSDRSSRWTVTPATVNRGESLADAVRLASGIAERWYAAASETSTPVLVNITQDDPDGQHATDLLRQFRDAAHGCVVFNCHLGSCKAERAVYPASPASIPASAYARALFDAASEIPEPMRLGAALLGPVTSRALTPGDRGFLFNADWELLAHMLRVALLPPR